MKRILLRFNTKFAEDPIQRKWRILVDGVESLAHKVILTIPCETLEEPVEGVQKFHFLCYGDLEWVAEDIAKIIKG